MRRSNNESLLRGLGAASVVGVSLVGGAAFAACSSSSGGTHASPESGPPTSEAGMVDGTSGADAPATDAASDTASSSDAPAGDAPSDAPPTDPPGIFVAVGSGGRHVRSADYGVTWMDDAALPPDAGTGDFIGLRTVVYGNGGFVGLGWRGMTSPDGNVWDDRGLLSINQWIGAAIYAQGMFVGVGGYGLRATSPDGIAWTNHGVDTVATHGAQCLVFGDVMGGRFVSCNDNGARMVSPDAKTWTAGTGVDTVLTSALAFGNSVFVGLASTSIVVSTDGGTTWASSPDLPSAGSSVLFAQGHFTVFGDGHVFTSPDGVTWTDHAVTGFTASSAVAFGHGTYVMLTGSGFFHSADGMTWSALVPIDNTTNPLGWLTYGAAP